MEGPKWEDGKAPNERKGKPKLEEGRRIQSEKRKTNSGTKTKEIQLKNAEIGMPKWEEGKAQTGGREKSSCTAAPSGLMLGSSMKRSEFTCWRYQLCALFSTFNENFCHNLSWKFNSLVIGTSFSQLTTQWVGEPDTRVPQALGPHVHKEPSCSNNLINKRWKVRLQHPQEVVQSKEARFDNGPLAMLIYEDGPRCRKGQHKQWPLTRQ